ncbi:hypothetical protein EDB81DRAFT_807573 [Dactylonectria macrodidyma]|uniref:Uncharacterized protein n=1 Tax=Dactylonectria macrodidyma TaxID=307937 RepID=A0A9P9E4Y7_9HYPO|nr:hypothetical protein EDB81DRAFT_807573 [Dactylonectria macrodidyma]
MEEVYRHLGSASFKSEQETGLPFHELSRNQTSGELDIRLCDPTQRLPARFDGNSTRLALIVPFSKRQWESPPAEEFSQVLGGFGLRRILSDFGLELAHNYAMSCVAGVAALPPQSKPNGIVDTYTLVYRPKLAAIWSFTRPASSAASTGQPSSTSVSTRNSSSTHFPTQAIILAGKNERDKLGLICKRWKSWDSALTSHAMFPAFLCGLIMSHEVDETQNTIKQQVRQVEVRTGHHNFASRQEQPAAGSMGQLSAKMSGFATKLASTRRKIKVARELQEFMLAHEKKGPAATRVANVAAVTLIEHHAKLMDNRLRMQLLDNEFILERVNIQLNTIFNLIAQEDSISMKALALVALIFLPGNFIAALFSAPLFDWDSANANSMVVATKPQFNLFWAITIPLTVLAFVLYVGWLLFQRRRRQKIVQGFGTVETV